VTEPELLARLAADGLAPGPSASASGWTNGPGDRYAAHEHGYDKVLVALRGSIRFDLPDDGDIHELAEGDRLDLPAGTAHAAEVGPDGVHCLEAHLPTGTVAGTARLVRGWLSPVETADGRES
jgi:quercetin dioxygenase-like cupin family protein